MAITVTMTEEENAQFMGTTFWYVQNLRRKFESGKISEEQFERYCDKLLDWEEVANKRTWEAVL